MHVGMHVCMYLCTYVPMHLCTYVSMYVCMYLCMYVCMYVCMYECMYVCMYAFRYVRACMFEGICVYTEQYGLFRYKIDICIDTEMYVSTTIRLATGTWVLNDNVHRKISSEHAGSCIHAAHIEQ